MNTVEINIKGFAKQVVSYPSEWNEINKEQLLFALQLVNKKILLSEFRVKAVQLFLGKKNELFKQYALYIRAQNHRKGNIATRIFWQNKLNHLDECIYGISENLKWIFEKTDLTKQIIPCISKFPNFQISKLYGPASAFADLTFIEFAKADTYFLSYSNTGETQYLNKLIAALYRPGKFAWRIRSFFAYGFNKRVSYSDDCLLHNLNRVEKLEDNLKQAILFWFKGCREYIVSKYPHVFKPSDSDENSESFGWAGILTQLAGGKFGDQDKTAFTKLHDILRSIEMDMVDIEQHKAKHPELYNE
jgi:hypothetical protein